MGRNSTGAWTTNESSRIELKYLLENKILIKGSRTTGALSWTNGSTISFETQYDSNEIYFKLKYTLTEKSNGNQFEYDYKIQLAAYPSNLGKGEVLYFLCPVTGEPCRILYRAYGSHIYKSRDSYQNRIYYPSQTCSKKDRHNNRYWKLEKQLKELAKLRKTSTYKGKVTKRALRVKKLDNKQWEADELRWSLECMPISLQKEIKKGLKL